VLIIVRDAPQYESFKATMQDVFPKGLPDYHPRKPSNNVAESAFTRAAVWFDADWTPHVGHLDSDTDLSMLIALHRWVATAFPLAIQPIYERAGLAMPGLPTGPRSRPWSVAAAIAVYALTAAAGASLLLRSVDGLSSVLWVLALVIALPGLLLHRVWRGGYLASGFARAVSLFFGGVFTLLFLVMMLLEGVNERLIVGGALSIGLLTGGLLLRRGDAREWIASLVLFR
jgi:hypothetical protein